MFEELDLRITEKGMSTSLATDYTCQTDCGTCNTDMCTTQCTNTGTAPGCTGGCGPTDACGPTITTPT